MTKYQLEVEPKDSFLCNHPQLEMVAAESRDEDFQLCYVNPYLNYNCGSCL